MLFRVISVNIKITTSHIVLSTVVENPANLFYPVKSGLVFEMVKSGLVPAKLTPIRFRSGYGHKTIIMLLC